MTIFADEHVFNSDKPFSDKCNYPECFARRVEHCQYTRAESDAMMRHPAPSVEHTPTWSRSVAGLPKDIYRVSDNSYELVAECTTEEFAVHIVKALCAYESHAALVAALRTALWVETILKDPKSTQLQIIKAIELSAREANAALKLAESEETIR